MMVAVERTTYPRMKQAPNAKELANLAIFGQRTQKVRANTGCSSLQLSADIRCVIVTVLIVIDL